MIFVAAAILLTVSGATAALAPKVSHAIGSCIRGSDQRVERDDILRNSSTPRAVVAQALPHRPASNRGSSNRNNDAGSFFILLQVHIGRQLLRVDSLDSVVRLFNFWGSIRFPPSQCSSPHEATERVLLWQGDAGHILTSSDQGVNDGDAGGSDNGAVVRLAVEKATSTVVTAAPGISLCTPVVFTTTAFVAAEGCGDVAGPADGVMAATSRAMMAACRPPPLSLGSPELTLSSGASTKATGMISPARQSTAAPSRGRRRTRQGPTSPRTRSTRPPSPRRAPVSVLRSPSPQRSGTAASTAAGAGAAAAALSSSRTTATRRDGPSAPSASRSEQDPGLLEYTPAKQASCGKAAFSRLTTPPLTPASTRSSAATTASTSSNNGGSGTFFGGSRGRIFGNEVGPEKGIVCQGPSKLPEGDSRGVVARNASMKDRVARAEQHVNMVKLNLQDQQQRQDEDEKRTSLQGVVPPNVAILEEAETSPGGGGGAKQELAEARSEGGGDDGGDGSAEAGIADPGTGEFGAIVDAVEPGQLRTLFIRNLRANRWGASSHTCARVRVAMMSLGENEEFGNVVEGLEEVEVLGEGSFGVVSAVDHSVLGGSFAIKKLKKGATTTARYCATVEMIALARLAAAPPHANVVSAVCMDDRDGAISSMPILLHRADNDLGRVLRTGGWGMPAKLSCLEQATSGLRHMHAHGIGHGDIKLENILLSSDGQGGCAPKLCDFGMSRALGELRPPMMGTPGYMPLEVMTGSVKTHKSQDTFAMAAAAFVVCVAPEKAQANMFTSPDLYTKIEAKRKKTLESLGEDDPFAEAQTQSFQTKMMKRTMGDGSFAKLLTADHLHPDLGSRDVMEMVSLCLPAFLDKNPDNRPDLANFQEVMKNLAVSVANSNGGINAVQAGESAEDDDEDRQSGGVGEEEDDADGIDLDVDDDDDDYFEEDDELF